MSDDVEKSSEVRGLLLPLSDRSLLIPNVLIAEVVETIRHVEPVHDAPSWLLGVISWRELKLPLISFESAETSYSGKYRISYIAVINAIGGRENCKFLAVALRGLPSAIKIDDQIDYDLSVQPEGLELSAVKLGQVQARIPDLQGLENKLAELGLI